MNPKQRWRKGLGETLEEQKKTGESRPISLRQAIWPVLLLVASLLLVWTKPPDTLLDETKWKSLHMMLEFLSILASLMIFGIGWHSGREIQAGNQVLIASAFLAAGLLNFAHLLSYLGMPDSVTPDHLQKIASFGLAAQFLTGAALLGAVAISWRPVAPKSFPYACLAGSLGLVALIGWAGWVWGQGIMRFKIGAESLIAAFYAATAALLWIRPHKLRSFGGKNLFVGAVVMIAGEVCFMRHLAVNDIYNLLGHVFKVIAYFYLYRAVRDISAQEEREKEQKRLLAILEKTSDYAAVTDVCGRVLYANRAVRNLFGLEEEKKSYLLNIEKIYPDWAARLVLDEGLPTAAKEGVWRGETAFISQEGKEIPVHQLILAHGGPDGKVERYSIIARDLSELKRSQEKERLAAKVFASTTEGIVITDANGAIVSVNPAFTAITGYSEEEVIGRNPSILNSGRHSPLFFQEMWTSLREKGHWSGEIWDKRKNGEIYLEEISISVVKDEAGKTTHYVGVFRDITLRKQKEEMFRFQAYHDALTGLPNRTLFLERLSQSIAYARQNRQMLAVMFLDLDRFKYINDTLGHHLGDRFLQEVAERLKGCVRTGDTVSRLGGDEFVILLSDVSGREDAADVAEKILERMSRPYMLNGQEYAVSASIGISLYPDDGSDEEALIRNADLAMYHAKEQGNRYQFFLPSMGVQSLERLKLENDLRRAVEREEFVLYYQPKVDLNTGEIVGAEVLVRWQHPELGMVSPAQFIPLAEEMGLILPLGEWVLRTALRQNKAWQDEGLAPVRVAVNLSMSQFQQKDLKEMIARILQETGFLSHFLELELTEGVMMSNPETTIRILRELKGLGIQISLDDFGTGYSSLSYLKQLPLDVIKIDRSFIQHIATNSEDRTVVKAMIDLAHSMKMSVVAEGVENEEQLRVLRSCQCDEIQGYFCSPPVPAETFKALLKKKKAFLAG